ncbi:hypothetical protein LCGC14_0873380 [marine sediment metagenome]|uniref:Uncharacterized protein n=1 Tax=marine sediment metagenome TaxID=412755 RepID=A0A0F9P401_9ZZZZ
MKKLLAFLGLFYGDRECRICDNAIASIEALG